MDAQLKRSLLPFCILKLLQKEDRYEYDIVKLIQEYFSETDQRTIYAVLRRLRKEGLTTTYQVSVSGGPSRKYDHLSELGIQRLNDYAQSWKLISKFIEKLGV